MSYSKDFRECVLRHIDEGLTWKEASLRFKVSTGSICRWMQNKESRGCVTDKPRKAYKAQKIDPIALKAAVAARPDSTLEELSKEFNCWPQSIHKRLVQLGITRKKNKAVH